MAGMTDDKRVKDCIEASNAAVEQDERLYDAGEIDFLARVADLYEQCNGDDVKLTPKQQAWLRDLHDKAVNSPY